MEGLSYLARPHCLCNVHFRRHSLILVCTSFTIKLFHFGAFNLSSRLCHAYYDGCIYATRYSWLTSIFSSKVFRSPVWLTGFHTVPTHYIVSKSQCRREKWRYHHGHEKIFVLANHANSPCFFMQGRIVGKSIMKLHFE